MILRDVVSRSAVALAAFGIAVVGAVSALEPRVGLPMLYEVRGPVVPPDETLIVGVGEASIIELIDADLADAPEFAACLPEGTLEDLERSENYQLPPRAIHGCLYERLASRGARDVVIDVHYRKPNADRAADNTVLMRGLRAIGDPILLEHIEISDGMAVRRPPYPAVAATFETGMMAVHGGTGVAYRYSDQSALFSDLISLPQAAAQRIVAAPVAKGDVILNYYGPSGTLPSMTIAEALTAESEALIRGKTVFVGVVRRIGAEHRDGFKIPYPGGAPEMSGVELIATAFLNKIDGSALRRLSALTEMGIILAIGLVMALAARLAPGASGALITLAVAGAWLVLAAALFDAQRLWLPVAAPVLLVAPIIALTKLHEGYADAVGILTRLMPGRLATEWRRDRRVQRPDPTVEPGTAMFVDLIGSTELASGMKTSAYAAQMTRFFDRLDTHIKPRGGMLLKYRGDGFLAVFTTSSAGPRHAAAALDASQAMMAELEGAMNDSGAPMRVRIGLDAGEIAIGEIGSFDRTMIDALGDTVNIAARLEELGKQFDDGEGQVVLATQRVVEAAGQPEEDFFDRGPQKIRGHPNSPTVLQLKRLPGDARTKS